MAPAFDVALATCHPLPEHDPDIAPISRALEAAGLTYEWLAWDDPAAPFVDARCVLIRSTWNYVHKHEAFRQWVSAQGERLVNPVALVRWNLHKGYLFDLGEAGLAVTPTELVKRGSPADLGEIVARRGWGRVVVKPAISAGSFQTYVIEAGAEAPMFAPLVAERDVLVQPYLESVNGYGERSIVVLDGEPTHAIRKTPRFAGQHESVSDAAMPIADDERAFALRAVDLTHQLRGEACVYARVDVARDDAGKLLLMELELVEPSLFFDQCPPAVGRLVGAISRRVRGR